MDTSIAQLYANIIPPSDYSHRNGFSNQMIIDKLDVDSKKIIENLLIDELANGSNDALIIETLSYLKSEKSLPLLYDLLETRPYPIYRLVVASFIYEIKKEDSLIDIAIAECERITNKWDLINVFYYLSKFNNVKTNEVIGRYINDKDFLISYNAKRFWIKP
ncbi:hypothetical protein [Mucilaginibacter sp. UYCu711]|uniref:hypothetical protein n=1 Tax=Mucilaginibacter sp. UYCu711 TaxID=3156339 RepID=UPI003D1EB250